MKFALGKKQEMTQIFDSEGVVHPVTLISLEPMQVAQIRTQEKDKYTAVKVAYGKKKEKVVGHKEIRGDVSEFVVGEAIDGIAQFTKGDVVKVTAISKGKGFAGVVKRHGFRGGNRSHGNHHAEREVGSIGSGLRTRVPKGMRMAGRMGSDQITVKNKTIVHVDKEMNLVMISGSVPGRRGTLVQIQKQ